MVRKKMRSIAKLSKAKNLVKLQLALRCFRQNCIFLHEVVHGKMRSVPF